MTLRELARKIHALRNSGEPSQIIQHGAADATSTEGGMGVLLFKPSSGSIPLNSITEVLERLVTRHRYSIQAVTWWQGSDIRTQRVMARHYPGFYRVAHGGLGALSEAAVASLEAAYLQSSAGSSFLQSFGSPFHQKLVQGPYPLLGAGISEEVLNEIWEVDRAKEESIRTIRRLDGDAFSLAFTFPDNTRFPAAVRNSSIVLLNGFFAKLEKDFETKGCIAVRIERPADSPTSWEELRANFAGKTNPFLAAAGTVRGDAARGLLPVQTVSILANVIHLSADEEEGRREVEQVWWAPDIFGRVFGVPKPTA